MEQKIYEIADVVRNLSFKQKEKGLSTGEKKMLLNAKQILVSELVLAEQKELNEIETLVESKINASYEEHLTSLGQGTTEENVVKKLIQLN